MSLLGFNTVGRFALGQITTIVTISLSASANSFLVTGNAAGLSRDFEAWLPLPFDTDGWTAAAVDGESWTPESAQAETWTARAKGTEPWTSTVKQPEPWTVE
jgi:hypothetical protein